MFPTKHNKKNVIFKQRTNKWPFSLLAKMCFLLTVKPWSENTVHSTFAVFEQQVPDPSAGVRVNPSCRFIQDDHLWASDKRYRHRQLPLHAAWQMENFKLEKKTEQQTCCFSFIKSQHTGVKLVTLPERFLVCSCRLCRRPTSSSKVSSSAFTSASDKPFIQP